MSQLVDIIFFASYFLLTFLNVIAASGNRGQDPSVADPTERPVSYASIILHADEIAGLALRGVQFPGRGFLRQGNLNPSHLGTHNPTYPNYPGHIPRIPQFNPKEYINAHKYGIRPHPYPPPHDPRYPGRLFNRPGGLMDKGEDEEDDAFEPSLGQVPVQDLDFEEGLEKCGGYCKGGEFLCEGSCTCIPAGWRCDGVLDCVGGQDEVTCSNILKQQECNTNTHIRCPRTWKCIKKTWICDGDDDCGDFSDETHCDQLNCTSSEFECSNGLCIPSSWLCDGDDDCRDYSDEANCTVASDCSKGHEFKCNDGTCISLSWRCDNEPDCSDNSDEDSCPEVIVPKCRPDELQCSYPRCVREEFRCDGDNDCGDWSDEDGCPKLAGGPCTDNEHRCTTGKCIPLKWKCDGENDCEEGDDEGSHCDYSSNRPCTSEEFQCEMGTCIMNEWVCDGVQDCPKGEDEKNCKHHCDPRTQFSCPSLNATQFAVGSHCIKKKQVCDGIKNCQFGEDELRCPVTINCTSSSQPCQHLCIKTFDDKLACACHRGYTLGPDGIHCVDVNECDIKSEPVCSQVCNNTIGSYICSCYKGYELRPDGSTCKALGDPPTLLFANRVDIRQVSLNNMKYTLILKGLHNAIALDYHYAKKFIFWTDVSMDEIRRSKSDGSNVTDVTRWGLDSPGGIAVDWIHDLVFWTDSGTRRVEVANLSGSSRYVLVSYDLEKPRAVAVHPGEAYVFWTDWGPKPKIERCEMDGSNRVTVVTESIQWPNGITIDYTTDRIYWSDAKHHIIESSNLDGAERKKVVTKGLPHPFAISLFEDSIYWTDWHTKSISTANKATGSGFRTIHSGLHYPMDIHCYHPQRQPSYANRCGNDNGGCSHLCLPNQMSFSCVCPLGLRLMRNNRTCEKTKDHMLLIARKKDLRLRPLVESSSNYDVVIPVDGIKSVLTVSWDPSTDSIFWSDIETKAITSAKINGSDETKVVKTNLEIVTGLAVDWVTNKIYWADAGTRRIEVSNLDGTMRSLLVWDNMDEPRDIALNPMSGYMYWSDWGDPGRIERAGMDGSNRTLLFAMNMTRPNGLCVDFSSSRLYWTDSGRKTIEYASLDGSGRKTLMSGLPHPFGLAIFGNKIVWTDSDANAIFSADKLTGKNQRSLRTGLSGLVDLKVIEHEKEPVIPKCDIDNGGCSHLCLLSPIEKGYVCACPIGIRLKPDLKTCHNTPSSWLIVAHHVEILQIALDMPYIVDVVLPLPPLKSAVTVDVDSQTGEIYWSDTVDKAIGKADLNFGVAVVIDDGLYTCDGIVVDEIGRKLYWTDSGRNNIQVCELNDCETNRKVLIWNHLDKPRAITLDYDKGLLFWTDWGDQPRIEQSNMDGDNRMTLISERLTWPNGISVNNGRVYWTDAKLKTIESASLTDTTDRVVLMRNISHPYALVVLENHIFWTDWLTDAIHRSNLNGNEVTTIVKNIRGPMDIKAVTTGRKNTKNVCEPNNGGCSHLCLRAPRGYTCACPTGVSLMSDNRTCDAMPHTSILIGFEASLARISMDTKENWLVRLPTQHIQKAIDIDFHWNKSMIFYVDFQLNSIKGIKATSLSNSWVIANNLSSPSSLAVDWIADNLYWIETGISKVVVSRLDGSSKKILMTPPYELRCIAVYPQKGLIFWTSIGERPKIERAYMDGSCQQVIIDTSLQFPNGLVVDYQQNKIYWSDGLNDKIEVSDVDGTNRILLIPKANNIIGLSVLGDSILWLNYQNKELMVADVVTGRDVTVMTNFSGSVMGMCAVSKDLQQGWNPCAENNGHCSHLCFFRSLSGYTCGCPDDVSSGVGSPCSTEPKLRVPFGDAEGLVDLETSIPSEVPESSTSGIIMTGAICSIAFVALLTVAIVISLFYNRRRRRQRKYMYPGRSILTFSNPNYNSSTSDVGNNPNDKRLFLWRKFRFEKSQPDRVFAEHGDSDKSGSAEVVSLIPVPTRSPCPSPTPTNSIALESSTHC